MLLTMLLAFLLDAAAVYAGTRALIAVHARRPITVANWGLVVNICAGTTLLLAVFGDTIPVFLAGCAGAYLGDWWATEQQRRREQGSPWRECGTRKDT